MTSHVKVHEQTTQQSTSAINCGISMAEFETRPDRKSLTHTMNRPAGSVKVPGAHACVISDFLNTKHRLKL